VILRIRSGKSGDSTVKLRPCRRTQLTPDWVEAFQDGDDFEYRVEEDWGGPRQTLAASGVRELAPRLIDAVTAKGANPGTVFGGRQREFLRDCGDLRVTLEGLAPLGPVQATKWRNVPAGGFDTSVERWM
jgi:hypothetical protein